MIEPEKITGIVHGTNIELPVMLAMWLSMTVSEIRGLTKSESIDGDYITIRSVLLTVNGKDVRKELADNKINAYFEGIYATTCNTLASDCPKK